MKWVGNLLSCFALCVLLGGCGTDLQESIIRSSTSISTSELTATSSSSVSETSSISESNPLSSSSSADEDVVSWDSVLIQYAVGPNPKGAGWYIWQNLFEDTETITTLWNIVETAQSTTPHRFQKPPDGGFPFEVNFISDNVTIECAFFSQCVCVSGVWYEFTNDGYEEVLSLTGWNAE